MSKKTSLVDFRIWRAASGGLDDPLPCAFYESTPAFRWSVPEGFDQVSYCFEMRTFQPKLRSDGTYRCAYYNSGVVESSSNLHRLSFSMSSQTIDGITRTVATWLGLCEVRIRIFDKNGNECTSHEHVNDGTVYDFEAEAVLDGNGDVIGETPKPQGVRWGTRNDGMYFVFDDAIDTSVNMNRAKFAFSLDMDPDAGQSLLYDFQISDTPLFGEGLLEDPVLLEASNVESAGAMNTLNASIDTNDGAEERMSTEGGMPLPIVLPNKPYYFRARSFDGYDHSEWSRVHACRFVWNNVPHCEITSVETPKILNTKTGEWIEGDRPRGEMVVKFRIRDNDDASVRAELCFSMETTEAEAARLNVLPNINGEALDYMTEMSRASGSKLIRARTIEPLIQIPTYRAGEAYREITVTWLTDREMSGRRKTSVYLYLNAFDGISQSNTSVYGPITVDDAMIGEQAGASVNNPPRFWTDGSITWTLCRPILPDAMQRTLVSEKSMYVPEQEDDEDGGNGGDGMEAGLEEQGGGGSKKGGGRGQAKGDGQSGDGAAASAGGAGSTGSGPNQTSTYNTAACPWHAAWKAYEDGTFLYETGKFDESGKPITRNSDKSYGVGRITGTGPTTFTEWAKYTVMKFVDYVDAQRRVHYFDDMTTSLVRAEQITVYDTDDGSPREIITYVPDTEGKYYSYYAKKQTIETGNGFVSYCEKCDTLEVLKTMVRKPGSDTLYESVAEAWPDGSYDGTPYELVFKCEKCKTVYEMDHRYFPDLSWSAWSFYKKPIFSYWYGYNRDGRPEYDQAMSLELAMTTKQEFDYLENLWAKEHPNGEDGKPEESPYSFVLMKRWYKDRPEWAPLESKEQYGLLYADTLLNLEHRPEFGPYMAVIPPRAKPYHFARYLDGLQLNACVKTDYMYGYEKKEGDPDLRKLAAQAPWAYPYMMSWQHFEGRVTMDKDAKGYAGADGSMGGVSGESEDSGENGEGEGNSGDGDGGGDGDGDLSEGSPVVEACFDMSNACVAQGTPFEVGENQYVRVYNRLSCAGNVQFPITITRGVNDRFLVSVNGKEEFSGSVLPEGESKMVIGFVYDKMGNGTHKPNSNATDFRNTCLQAMFGMAFDVAGAESLQFPEIAEGITSYNGIDLVAGTISYSIYGLIDDEEKARPHPEEEKESSSSQESSSESSQEQASADADPEEDDISIFAKYDRFISTFELKPCDNSCYDAFGLVPFKSFQSHATYRDGDSPILNAGPLPEPPSDGGGAEGGSDGGGSTGRTYAYTSIKRTKREYDCQESPMDNTIEDSYGRIIDGSGSSSSSGQGPSSKEAGARLSVTTEISSEFAGTYTMSSNGAIGSYRGVMTNANGTFTMLRTVYNGSRRWVIVKDQSGNDQGTQGNNGQYAPGGENQQTDQNQSDPDLPEPGFLGIGARLAARKGRLRVASENFSQIPQSVIVSGSSWTAYYSKITGPAEFQLVQNDAVNGYPVYVYDYVNENDPYTYHYYLYVARDYHDGNLYWAIYFTKQTVLDYADGEYSIRADLVTDSSSPVGTTWYVISSGSALPDASISGASAGSSSSSQAQLPQTVLVEMPSHPYSSCNGIYGQTGNYSNGKPIYSHESSNNKLYLSTYNGGYAWVISSAVFPSLEETELPEMMFSFYMNFQNQIPDFPFGTNTWNEGGGVDTCSVVITDQTSGDDSSSSSSSSEEPSSSSESSSSSSSSSSSGSSSIHAGTLSDPFIWNDIVDGSYGNRKHTVALQYPGPDPYNNNYPLWTLVYLDSSTPYTIGVYGDYYDTIIYLVDSEGVLVASNDDMDGTVDGVYTKDTIHSFYPSSSGWYRIGVSNYDGSTSSLLTIHMNPAPEEPESSGSSSGEPSSSSEPSEPSSSSESSEPPSSSSSSSESESSESSEPEPSSSESSSSQTITLPQEVVVDVNELESSFNGRFQQSADTCNGMPVYSNGSGKYLYVSRDSLGSYAWVMSPSVVQQLGQYDWPEMTFSFYKNFQSQMPDFPAGTSRWNAGGGVDTYDITITEYVEPSSSESSEEPSSSSESSSSSSSSSESSSSSGSSSGESSESESSSSESSEEPVSYPPVFMYGTDIPAGHGGWYQFTGTVNGNGGPVYQNSSNNYLFLVFYEGSIPLWAIGSNAVETAGYGTIDYISQPLKEPPQYPSIHSPVGTTWIYSYDPSVVKDWIVSYAEPSSSSSSESSEHEPESSESSESESSSSEIPSSSIVACSVAVSESDLPDEVNWMPYENGSVAVTRDGDETITVTYGGDDDTQSESAEGEPMFTCYLDEVDQKGHHFRYTEEDFRKTGKIYVRRYHVETCNPFPMPGFGPGDEPGWRDWLVFPIPGKPGRYCKKKVLGFRGIPPVCRQIEIEFPDGTTGLDWAWFSSDDPNATPFSHHRKKVKQETDEQGNPKPIDPPPPYVRNEDYLWRNKLSPKTCVVFEYVDLHDAICKNLVEEQQGIPPLNHHAPFGVFGGTYGEMAKRYGIYVMGGYDLTDEQKSQANDGGQYTKSFSSSELYIGADGKVSSSWVEYQDMMPNNWRCRQIDSVFDVDPADEKTAKALVLEVKGGSSSWTERSFLTTKKFNDAWSGKISEPEENVIAASKLDENGNPGKKPYELSQYTVEQFSPMMYGHVGIYRKIGYQPKHRIGDYFKVDGNSVYGEKYIPFDSNVVHETYDDPYLDYRLAGLFERERRLISDKSFQPVNELYTKAPYLDYRLLGRIYGYYMYYFSGYPRSESPTAYANRPEPVYPYDRQWRILGEITGDESYDFGEFMYLQSEWNQYNRLHWRVAGNQNVVGILYATHLVNEGTAENPSYQPDAQTPPFSVKTKNSYWSDERNAWLIPHSGSVNTDTIDTQSSQFVDGERYRFTMRFYTASTLQQQDVVITSTIFTTSRYAVSPATITETSYDPWTRTLYITFRFDDALGRKYDIVGFQYILDDTTTDSEGRQATNNAWITPGEGTGITVLKGDLLDLASNMNGDNVPTESLIIKHTVRVSVADLGITTASAMRVRLLAELSANRTGLTLPLFEARFWANEFLKPVEEEIMSLEGYETDWIWQAGEEDSSTGKWVKSDTPVMVEGRIHESQARLDEIDAEFETWYVQNAQFAYPDLDAMETWMKSTGQFDELYYGDALDEYISENDGYADSLGEYVMAHEGMSTGLARMNWLAVSGHEDDYAAWFKLNRNRLVKSALDPVPQEFTSWMEDHAPSEDRMEAALEYAKSRIGDYRSYYGLDETFGEEEEGGEETETEQESQSTGETETYDAEQEEEEPSTTGFTVSGAGNDHVNGQYLPEHEKYVDDTGERQDIYTNGAYHLSFDSSIGWWWIGIERDWKTAIYVSVNVHDGQWETLDGGISPAPKVEVATSSDSSDSSSSDSSESSEEEEPSSSESSESSEEEHLMTHETAFEYVCSTHGRYNGFMTYYAKKCGYLDTRFDERCLIMRDQYGVETEGVCENAINQAPVSQSDAAEWAAWLDGHGSEWTNISDQYAAFLGQAILVNRGRSAARQAFMSMQYGNGMSYSLTYQSIYSEISQMKQDLADDYATKCRVETDHRADLVKQGYFCNGFEGNQPFDGDKVNTCFRWRVETRPYEGSFDEVTSKNVNGWQPRFDMFVRFQMDFLHTFDSQPGKAPLRDLVFIGGEGDDYRIRTGIQDVDYSARTTPDAQQTEASTVRVSDQITKRNKQLAQQNGESDGTTSTTSQNMLQYVATWALPKTMLPGNMDGDSAPEAWEMAWEPDKGESIDGERDAESLLKDFRSAYYWRIAPYNLVDRPVFDAMTGTSILLDPLGDGPAPHAESVYRAYAIPTQEMLDHDAALADHANDGSLKDRPEDEMAIDQYVMHRRAAMFVNDYHSEKILAGTFDRQVHVAVAELQVPAWRKNSESVAFSDQLPPYSNGISHPGMENVLEKWINLDGLKDGIVQFATDRPRQAVFPEESSSSSSEDGPSFPDSYSVSINESIEQYAITNYYTTVDGNDYPIYQTEGNMPSYLYKCKYNGQYSLWIIGYQPSSTESEPDSIEPTSIRYICYIADMPDGEDADWRTAYGEPATITVSSGGSQEEEPALDVSGGAIEFIEDNIGNYKNEWIPFTPIRRKPVVVKINSQYVMLANKTRRTVTLSRTVNGTTETLDFPESVITLSRGFSSDVFGEERVCFPKYSYETLDGIIEGAISFDGQSVCLMPNNKWRMHFNVLFNDNGTIRREIWKADTTDFEEWTDFAKITVMNGNTQEFNVLEPFVCVVGNAYEMYASSRRQGESYMTIKRYASQDGSTYEYSDTITIGTDGAMDFTSPYVVNLDATHRRMYLRCRTLPTQQTPSTASVIASIESDGGNWNETPYSENTSRLVIEKSNSSSRIPYPVNFTNDQFMWPCVLVDTDCGMPVLRMYYNAFDDPYVWHGGQLKKTSGAAELSIRTEYLEMYSWRTESLYASDDIWGSRQAAHPVMSTDLEAGFDPYGSSVWTPLERTPSQEDFIPGESQGLPPENLPAGKWIRYEWWSEYRDCLGVKITTGAVSRLIECMSQGPWLWFGNAGSTSAILRPEAEDLDYTPDLFTPKDFIKDNTLESEYLSWLRLHEKADNQDSALEYLIDAKSYPQYIWWARKGPGIYRYVGWELMQNYTWTGDVIQEPSSSSSSGNAGENDVPTDVSP